MNRKEWALIFYFTLSVPTFVSLFKFYSPALSLSSFFFLSRVIGAVLNTPSRLKLEQVLFVVFVFLYHFYWALNEQDIKLIYLGFIILVHLSLIVVIFSINRLLWCISQFWRMFWYGRWKCARRLITCMFCILLLYVSWKSIVYGFYLLFIGFSFFILIDPNYVDIYEQYLRRKKSVKLTILNCMVIGPPQVGKTTLKKHLLADQSAMSSRHRRRPPSTSVMDSVERIVVNPSKTTPADNAIVNQQSGVWKAIDLNEKFAACLEGMTVSPQALLNAKLSSLICMIVGLSLSFSFFTEQFNLMMRTIPIKTVLALMYDDLVHMNINWITIVVYTVIAIIHIFLIKFTHNAARAVVKSTVLGIDVKNLRIHFDKNHLINIRDCGGQPEFHEVLPALVSHSTLFLLMFNLDKGLDRQYEVTYKANHNKISDSYMSSFTVKQSLLQCLASIKSIGSYSYSKPRPSLISRIWHRLTFSSASQWKKSLIETTIVIGTHKDLLMDKQAQVEEIQQILESEIKRTDWYSSDMIVPTPDRHLVLAIDTFDQTDINTVKEMISGSVLNRELEVPVPWLALEFCIQKLNNRVMSLKEVRQLASGCNIDTVGNEFQTVLWFLHHTMGTIRYFENVPEMRDTVITDPQVLLDLVTDLIVKTFSFTNLRSSYWDEKFQSSGRFLKRHLKECKAVQRRLLSEEQIIALLQHLNIIAPVGVTDEGEKEYFLPCVLVHATLPPSSSDRSTTLATAVAAGYSPLLITFKCQYTPRGMFSCLIAHILRTSQGQWNLASDKIYRNQVEFHHVDSGHHVLIRNFFQFLEVTITQLQACGDNPTISTVRIPFVKIQQFLKKCVEEVREQLNYSSTAADHMFAFYCSHDHSPSTAAAAEPHPAVCVTNISHTVCSIDTTLRANLTPEQAIWFNDDTVNPDEVLCIKDLNLVVGVLRNGHFDVTKWYRLGVSLGLYDTRLKEIQSDNRSSIDCLYSCLSDWLRQVDKVKEVGIPTWVTLATAMKSVGEPHIADRILKCPAELLV